MLKIKYGVQCLAGFFSGDISFPSCYDHILICFVFILSLHQAWDRKAIFTPCFLRFRVCDAAGERPGLDSGAPSPLTALLSKVLRLTHPTLSFTSHQRLLQNNIYGSGSELKNNTSSHVDWNLRDEIILPCVWSFPGNSFFYNCIVLNGGFEYTTLKCQHETIFHFLQKNNIIK